MTLWRMTISVSGPQLWPSGAHMAPPQHPHSVYTAITPIITAPDPIFLARSWGCMPLRGDRDALCHSSRRCRLGSRPRMADPVWAWGDACHGGACALPMIWDASRANSLYQRSKQTRLFFVLVFSLPTEPNATDKNTQTHKTA